MFHTFLYQPLFNALVFLYEYVTFQDVGLAIIVLTLVIRLILYPLFYKSFHNQTVLQKLQPEIKRIQSSNKGNKEKQAQELLALYKENKVNPFSSFLVILVQLPILFALYRVFLNGFSPDAFVDLYSFLEAPVATSNTFLGLIDLAKSNILIVALAALAQYFQGRLALGRQGVKTGEESTAQRLGKNMMYIGPGITVVLLYTLPSAIGLYWLTTSAFSIVQQVLINRSLAKKNNNEQPQGTNTTTT